jgi:enamine deaminase RidA (YjgF/YER057c/UK114 family)
MEPSEITRHGVTKRWSDAVVHREIAYFVEVADDPDQDAEGQIKQVLKQMGLRLEQVGSDSRRLLQVVIYLPNPNDLPTFNSLWDNWIPSGSAPSRACIHANLADPRYCIELVVTAALAGC